MSRLESHRQKMFRRQLIFYGVLFIIVVFFLFTYGIKFLINGGLYITNLLSGNKYDSTAQSQNSDLFRQLQLDQLPEATNSAQIIVSGTARDFDNVTIYINDSQVKQVSVKDSQAFSEEVGDLQKGSNSIYVKAVTKDKKTEQKSDTQTVMYTTDKPKLDVDQPKDGDKTNKEEIQVSGKTNNGIFIRVNGLPVVVDASGSFKTSVRLKDGDNKIDITAQDDAGNQEIKSMTVNYNKDN